MWLRVGGFFLLIFRLPLLLLLLCYYLLLLFCFIRLNHELRFLFSRTFSLFTAIFSFNCNFSHRNRDRLFLTLFLSRSLSPPLFIPPPLLSSPRTCAFVLYFISNISNAKNKEIQFYMKNVCSGRTELPMKGRVWGKHRFPSIYFNFHHYSCMRVFLCSYSQMNFHPKDCFFFFRQYSTYSNVD